MKKNHSFIEIAKKVFYFQWYIYRRQVRPVRCAYEECPRSNERRKKSQYAWTKKQEQFQMVNREIEIEGDASLCLYNILLCGVRHVIERRARPDTRPALFSSQQPTPDHLSLSQYVNSGTKTPCIERHNVRPCF
jgi:hypothetical protein